MAGHSRRRACATPRWRFQEKSRMDRRPSMQEAARLLRLLTLDDAGFFPQFFGVGLTDLVGVLVAALVLAVEHQLGNAVVRHFTGTADADELQAALGLADWGCRTRAGLLDRIRPIRGQLRRELAPDVAHRHVKQALGELPCGFATIETRPHGF